LIPKVPASIPTPSNQSAVKLIVIFMSGLLTTNPGKDSLIMSCVS
jgi:hypothetical protein